MAGHRLKLKLIAFPFVFAITIFVAYEVLSQTLQDFNREKVEEFHVPHLQDVANQGDYGFSNNGHVILNHVVGGLQSKSNDPDNRISTSKFLNSSKTLQRCNTTVTILIPGMYPFKAWREYSKFWQEFTERSTRSNKGLQTLHLKCPMQRCDVNVQATMKEMHLNSTDAIVVNMFPNVLKHKLLDLLSHLRQILHHDIHWFFYGLESPQMMVHWDPNIGEILYHHSITYHSEADIRFPYGEYVPGKPAASDTDWSANKTALIAWMASNCKNTFWPRNDFVHELNKYIPVDIYGECGTLTCLPALSERCTNLMASYKFYLALENAECDEYITEKVWSNGLLQGAVPVVYGGRKEAYERLLPPKSFIHIADFDSMQSLATYLRALDKDKNMYDAYHDWRKYGSIKMLYPPLDSRIFCKIVPFVSKPPPPFRTVRKSKYFKGCRRLTGTFAEEGMLDTFVPWKIGY